MTPSKQSLSVLGQLFQYIPRNLIPKLADEHGVSRRARRFTPTSHVLALMFAQVAHSVSLNDVCDCLRNHSGAIGEIRRSVAPSRSAVQREPGAERRYGQGSVLVSVQGVAG